MQYTEFVELFRDGLVSQMNLAKKILAGMDPRERARFIERMTESEHLNARSRAILWSDLFQLPNSERIARRFLEDSDPSLRMDALTILIKQQPPDLPDLLIYVLLHDREQFARSLAAFYLGRFARVEDLPVMVDCMAADEGVDHEGNRIRDTLRFSIIAASERLGI